MLDNSLTFVASSYSYAGPVDRLSNFYDVEFSDSDKFETIRTLIYLL
jgi:hypothetical protein